MSNLWIWLKIVFNVLIIGIILNVSVRMLVGIFRLIARLFGSLNQKV